VGPEPPITFHLDEEPEWAGGRRYRRIVGVALSPWRVDNGALLIGSESDPTPVELDAGDAVMLGRTCATRAASTAPVRSVTASTSAG
jgi:hypothetical protein